MSGLWLAGHWVTVLPIPRILWYLLSVYVHAYILYEQYDNANVFYSNIPYHSLIQIAPAELAAVAEGSMANKLSLNLQKSILF